VVIVKQDQNEDKHAAAYFVSDHQPSIMELREYLANHLPAYMVPSFFIPVDFIPLTPNGKLDRKALESHDTHIHGEVEYIAPQTGLENTVAHIWQEVLGVDKVGINDNFFNIGGNSIKVIQLNAQLKAALKTDIPVAIMFRYLTIRSFIDYLNREKGDEVFAGEDLDESIRLMEETNQLLSTAEEETEEEND
jgi:acyl carrier protein